MNTSEQLKGRRRTRPEILEEKLQKLESEIEKVKQQLRDYWSKRAGVKM